MLNTIRSLAGPAASVPCHLPTTLTFFAGSPPLAITDDNNSAAVSNVRAFFIVGFGFPEE
jgi:hypothetical protein